MPACAAAILSFSETIGAANTWFTRDMPISRMSSEDVGIMQNAVYQALDTAADGETRRWENGKTGARGDLTPRATFTDSGMNCRDLEIANSAGGLSNRMILTLCKTTEGWKIKSD